MKESLEILQRKYFSNTNSVILFLFCLTIILTLFPFFKIGFTSGDDMEYYMTGLEGELFENAYWYATGQGRFYQLITKPLAHVAYIIDNFYFTKIIQYSFLLITFTLFAITIQKLFKLRVFSLLVFLLLFTFLPVTREYDFMPIISYPLGFSLSFSIFLLSVLFLLKYKESLKNIFLVLSAVFFAVTLLFYENYLILSFFIFGFIFSQNLYTSGKSIFRKKAFYKEILPYLFITVVYLIIYFVYRKSVGTVNGFYQGVLVAKKFSIENFFEILWNYNKVAFPTYLYHNSRSIVEANSLLAGGHHHDFWYMLRNTPITGIINTFIQCFLFVFLFTKMKGTLSWKKISIGILTTVLLSFAVHVLVGVSEKYNASGWHTHSCYVTTFYSYFFITLLIGLIFYAIFKLCTKNKWLKNSIIGIFCILIFYISIIIGYTNDHLSRDWQLSQNRFKSIDRLIEKGIFNNIPENSIIYANDLMKTSSKFGYVIWDGAFDIERYISLKTPQKYHIYDKIGDFTDYLQKDSSLNIYYITQYDSPKSLDVLTILSKVNPNSLDWENKDNPFHKAMANESTVYYYSANKEFDFQFVVPCSEEKPRISVNNGEAKESYCNLNTIKIVNNNKKEEITTFQLKSNTPFLINQFSVSTIGNRNEEAYYLN